LSDRRPHVLINVAANFAGQVVAALAGVLSVPFYLRFLGPEAIGLIGFSLGLQSLVRMLDMGMSAAVVRQMARLGGQSARGAELREFYGTFERLFVGAGLVIAAVLLALSPFLATHWLRSERLSHGQVVFAVAAIGVQSALIFVGALYHGALMGLERQVRFNSIRVIETCVSQVGAVLLLAFWTPRIEVLFGWQLLVSVVAFGFYAGAARGAMPEGQAGPFRFAHVRGVWKFAAGMAGITATGTVLVNMDKVLLGRWLRLASFGHYTLAFYAASLVGGLLVAPVFNALFPRNCTLVEAGDDAAQGDLYHFAMQLLVAVVWPVGVILWVFAPQVLQLWIRDAEAVDAAQRVLPFLVAGVALNTLMVPAYMLQLSHAWTTLGFRLNLVLIAAFAPALYVMTVRWGIAGAAINFAVMQGTYLVIGLPLTHRRLLRGALAETLLRDMLPGIALCVIAALALAGVRDAIASSGPVLRYAAIIAAWAVLTGIVAGISPRVRWADFRGMARTS
jgi:O-antigen/teichoic acid export membrane protein